MAKPSGPASPCTAQACAVHFGNIGERGYDKGGATMRRSICIILQSTICTCPNCLSRKGGFWRAQHTCVASAACALSPDEAHVNPDRHSTAHCFLVVPNPCRNSSCLVTFECTGATIVFNAGDMLLERARTGLRNHHLLILWGFWGHMVFDAAGTLQCILCAPAVFVGRVHGAFLQSAP